MIPLIPTVSAFVGGLVAKEVLFPTVAPPTRVVTQYVPVAAPPAWEPERPAMAYVGTQSGFKQALAMSTLKQQQTDAALKARAHAPPPATTTPYSPPRAQSNATPGFDPVRYIFAHSTLSQQNAITGAESEILAGYADGLADMRANCFLIETTQYGGENQRQDPRLAAAVLERGDRNARLFGVGSTRANGAYVGNPATMAYWRGWYLGFDARRAGCLTGTPVGTPVR